MLTKIALQSVSLTTVKEINIQIHLIFLKLCSKRASGGYKQHMFRLNFLRVNKQVRILRLYSSNNFSQIEVSAVYLSRIQSSFSVLMCRDY